MNIQKAGNMKTKKSAIRKHIIKRKTESNNIIVDYNIKCICPVILKIYNRSLCNQ